MSFDLKTYLKNWRVQVDNALKKVMPQADLFPSKVHEAMHYSLFAGGKRVRPILTIAATEALGGDPLTTMSIGCALEMIHTFSLIHDDLPAMDDDNFRRGVPTNHKVFGEAMAILAGDALHSQAFITLANLRKSAFDLERVLEVVSDIADATGSCGMVGGQVVDLESEGKKLDLNQLSRLHGLKTGRLIAVAVTAPAKLLTTHQSQIRALEDYGQAIGLAFQVADDILDIEGGEDLGKDIGSDVENNKATYPSLMGLDQAKQEAQRLCAQAHNALVSFGPQADPLRAIAHYIVDRKK